MVSIHDVTPVRVAELTTIFAALAPLVGRTLSAAVVPCWHGTAINRDDGDFLSLVGGSAGELLLHGWTHEQGRRRGLVSLVTDGADEFSRLPREEAQDRVRRGRELLSHLFDRPVGGFLPPAYCAGPLDGEVLAAAGIDFRVGWSVVETAQGAGVRLATQIWDVSRIGRLGWLGETAGRLAALRRGAIPAIAIHPVDVARGFLPRALAAVRTHLAAGRRPVVFRDLFPASRNRP